MFSIKIKIDTIEKVKALVSAATTAPFEINVVNERQIVDAESILGIFSVNRSAPVKLEVSADRESDEAKAFVNSIREFIESD